ncbi:MAG: esterase [Planctomycetota bacterium]|nr:esterase [Planctomycetota bacterium]
MQILSLILAISCIALPIHAQEKTPEVPAKKSEAFVKQQWTVDGVERTALVHVPSDMSASMPLVFCWHGHGGSAERVSRSWAMLQAWPEAILVFPQGLPTVGKLTDPEGKKSGWQHANGENGDRDLKFFDAMLASLRKEYKIDDRQIYSTGHSNGGGFTYLLWKTRGTNFAAIAPVAAASLKSDSGLIPIPVLHIAGKNDPLVKFSWQQKTFDNVRKANDCSNEAKPWVKEGVFTATIYESTKGAPLITAIHEGKHEYPKGSAELIVRFFKEHPKPDAKAGDSTEVKEIPIKSEEKSSP